MQHYYGGNEILIFLIEVVLAGPPSPLTKYLKDCFKSSRIPGSFGQVIHLPIPDKLVGFHQLLLEPFHINIDEKLCTMYPLTSPYYTQQFGVSILFQIVQYIHRHTRTTLQLFTPHLLHSVTFRHSWGGGRNCIGQPQKYYTIYMDCQIFLCFCAKTWH